MNGTNKTLALLAFAQTIGKEKVESGNDKVAWRGEHFFRAARKAASKYPASALKVNQIKKIEKHLIAISNMGLMQEAEHSDPVRLGFLLCGVDDILSHTKNKLTKKLFSDVAKKSMWLNDLADPRTDKTADYIRSEHYYEKWTGEQMDKIPDDEIL